ncbi:MAG: DUF445 family protein [Planctomycetes bacterium]|nr:DUF445 family protein [Planctomycetota bacterium]
MDVALSTWIGVPLLGGVIGWVTNWIAVKMIFRPIKPRRFLGIRVQGLIGRRQKDLARSVGEVVGDHLVQHDDIIKGFRNVDLDAMLTEVLERGMAPKIEELRNLPLIGGFLTPERIKDLRAGIVKQVMKQQDVIFEKLEEAVEKGLDVQELVEKKVAAFPVQKLESIVLKVASRELRAIEWLGGLLGVLIGVLQVLLIGWFA